MNNEIEVPSNALFVTKTDSREKILYANQAFLALSGYKEQELIGKPHSIIRHTDMPALIFKLLWEKLNKGLEVHLYVKGRAKDGSFYWLFSNVFPVTDLEQNVIGYHFSRKKADENSLIVVKQLYKKFIDLEKAGGVKESQNYFNEFLNEKRMDYNEFILSI